jgi:peroxiredoxin
MPMLAKFAREQGATGVQVVGIALDDPAEARAFLAKRPTPFGHLVEEPDENDSSVHFGNLRGLLPFTVLVDAQGTLQHRKTGAFIDARELERWVAAGLPESAVHAQTAPN